MCIDGGGPGTKETIPPAMSTSAIESKCSEQYIDRVGLSCNVSIKSICGVCVSMINFAPILAAGVKSISAHPY